MKNIFLALLFISVLTPLKAQNPYIIPVVFHVVHNYGPENISDAQIYDAVEQVNIQLRKRNADTTNIDPLFKSIAADTEIEIRLAQLDPNGNCTNGITRTASPLTLPGDHTVKDVIQWPPNQYLNIYVCKDAAGLAGHALMPDQADTIPEWDGIVMKHDYVGTIGTSSYFRRTVVTHEIGHYLNLQHIWGGNNVPDFYYLPVASSGNCSHDDGVTDTPETIGWQTCQSNPQSCGTTDNIQNYMDYAYCALMFTEGQKTRMHNALNSSVSGRNNLWQPTNLTSTGTDGVEILCHAKFDANKKIICAGETVDFHDLSYHGVSSRLWDFNGGTPSSTSDSTVSVTYNSPGWYSVSLKASNGTDTVTHEEIDFIRVLPVPGNNNYLIESFESESDFLSKWTEQHTPNVSGSVTSTGFQSAQSYKFDNYNATGGTFELISPTIDASNATDFVINFDYAFAPQTSSDHDSFKVLISDDCGLTWSIRKYLYADVNLATSQPTATAFTPSSTDWVNLNIIIPPSYLNDHFLVKFVLENDGGNNLYLDNINVAHPDELGIQTYDYELSIYPNPSQGNITFEATKKIKYLEVHSIYGQKVLSYTPNTTKYSLNESLSPGTYIVNLTIDGQIRREKVVIK